jgi:hypothetical protein
MTPRCVNLLVALLALLVGSLMGGGFTFTLMRSLNKSAPAVLPQCPACGACLNKQISGHYFADVSMSKQVLGITAHTRYTISHTFGNGLVDVTLSPIETHLGLPSGYTCTGVPFKLDGPSCQVTIGNACTEEADKKNSVTSRQTYWDGKGNLTMYQSIQTTFFSDSFSWSELLRGQGPSGGECKNKKLQGRFFGSISAASPFMGITQHASFTTAHTFNDGTVDVELVPIKTKFGLPKAFTCKAVPFTLDGPTCKITFRNSCLDDAYEMNDVTEMQFAWDGKDNITVHQNLHAWFWSINGVSWSEVRQSSSLAVQKHAAITV